ncbi:uncharacterized protein [Antedon mediterranea]|uniref:uncharacterized protein n=1 Tax=Antedon mediterranea TaxID=105859 RepID=UPI003AF68F6F
MSHAKSSNHWFADGTFKVVPAIFFQLWTVHGVYEGHVVPLVYALLRNKTQPTYIRVLEVIRQLGDFNPTTIRIDYEMAARNALRQVFPDAQIKGCLFHLCQRIHERIKQAGLSIHYRENQEFRIQSRMIGAIAFAPEEDTDECFQALVNIAQPELLPILNYFEDTYIGRPQRNHDVRQAPRFSPEMWNVHHDTLAGGMRTTNHVEGWHHRFQVGIGADHPTFWMFLDCLKREQAMNEVLIGQAQAGAPPPAQRRAYRQTNQRILRLVEGYGGRDTLDFLRGVSHNLH